MKHLASHFLALIILALAGCASVPMGSSDQDTKAKDFATVSGKANLYIYRNDFIGASIPMGVDIDGKSIGQTVANTYFDVLLDPGTYTLQSHAENDSTLVVTLEGGKNYFVWQEVKMGFLDAKSLIQLVDEETGRAGVRESKLIAGAASEAPMETADTTAPPPASTPIPEPVRVVQALVAVQPPAAVQAAPEVQAAPAPVVIVPPVAPQPVSVVQVALIPPVTHSEPVASAVNADIKSGKSAFAVEKLARRQGCQFERGADLTGSNGPTIEFYQLQCNDGRVVKAKCEYRQCAIAQ